MSPDGRRIAFLRSAGGTDPVTGLHVLDLDTGEERLVADPAVLLAGHGEDIPATERARRERSREAGAGIVGYSADEQVRRTAFALSGRIWCADLVTGIVTEVQAGGGAVDPHIDPAGQRVGFVSGGTMKVASIGQDSVLDLAAPEGPDVSYGLAEHVAAEEMRRSRGFWWAPDGQRLLVARVDNSKVQRWYISDPAEPGKPPRELAYPAAGTANADVSLWIIGLDGGRTQVQWDRAALEYLVAVSWVAQPRIMVQSRDQRLVEIRQVDPATGETSLIRAERDDYWVTITPGVPATTSSGGELWVAADTAADSYRLQLDGEPVTPPGLQVAEVLDVDGDTVLFAASTEPTEMHLWTYHPQAGLAQLTTEPGEHTGRRAGGVTLVASRSLAWDGLRVSAGRDGQPPARIADRSERMGLDLRIKLIKAGQRELRAALLLPSWHQEGSGPLPVLLSPYGGSAMQLVVNARAPWFGIDQWFAEQGFAVLVTDNRGTPGRGPAWDRTVRGDIGGPVLEDQVAALHEVAAQHPDLDLGRVAIRGWSFGGFLAALAVLRRPDVFHAAIAGAAVSDQRLYDTYWRERFLGDPNTEPENYERCSLLTLAPDLTRPLMLVQGLADDNVFAANTLRLSSALLEAGRPHTVLPLSAVTHMLSQPAVTENLIRLELDFIRRALNIS
ncbi:MAG TPA: alpha/beta fold hydrolase [Streptosporangiaceae bacterium]